MADAGMQHYLGRAAREMRRATPGKHGHKVLRALDIAYEIPGRPHDSTLSRFERGETWPERVDVVISTYASVIGVTPVAIWRRAVELWELDEAAARGMTSALGNAVDEQRRRNRAARETFGTKEDPPPDEGSDRP